MNLAERRSPIRRVGVRPQDRAGSETGAPIARFTARVQVQKEHGTFHEPDYGETNHLTPALSPFCSADSAKHGEGETVAASSQIGSPVSVEAKFGTTRKADPGAVCESSRSGIMRTAFFSKEAAPRESPLPGERI